MAATAPHSARFFSCARLKIPIGSVGFSNSDLICAPKSRYHGRISVTGSTVPARAYSAGTFVRRHSRKFSRSEEKNPGASGMVNVKLSLEDFEDPVLAWLLAGPTWVSIVGINYLCPGPTLGRWRISKDMM